MITDYKDLTLYKYLEISKITEAENLSTNERNLAILAILTDKTEDDLLDLPIGEFSQLMSQAAFLTEKAPTVGVRKKYTCGLFTLVPSEDIMKMTAGQYIDFQEYATMKDLAGILSTVLVPRGHRYGDGYDPQHVREAILNKLPITDANALMAFFLRRCNASIRAILFCSAWIRKLKGKQRRTMRRQIRADLRENGAGWRR